MLSKFSSLFKKKDKLDEDEIISMVNEGHEKGVFEASEAEMINKGKEGLKSIIGKDAYDKLKKIVK